MIGRLTWRLLCGVSPRLLWKAGYNFCWKGMWNMHRFMKRCKKGEPFFPAFMVLSLTSRCNLICQGCWVSPKKGVELSEDVVSQIIDSCRKKGSYFFGLLGGEPLLYPHLFDILKKYPDCYFQLFTNGTLLTEEVAEKLRKLGNVTPLISIEGLEKVSDERRGGKNVFSSSQKGLHNAIKAKLLTGVAASICQSNFSELVNRDYVRELIKQGAHYLWYYTYRPVGPRPCPELALTDAQILELRRFIVDIRCEFPLIIVDAYWDAEGKALCPAAVGLSHHIGPAGHIEFCPPLQFADAKMEEGSDFADKIENSPLLETLRKKAAQATRGCIIQKDPQVLHQWVSEEKALDSSGRDSAYDELAASAPCGCHDLPGQEIPERHWVYRLAKKYYFFGFGAYG